MALPQRARPAAPATTSVSAPRAVSASPFRYVRLPDPHLPSPSSPAQAHPLASFPPHPLSLYPSSSSESFSSPSKALRVAVPARPLRIRPPPPSAPLPPAPSGCAVPDRLKPWIGVGSWVVTSLAFVLAVAFWRDDVFQRLEELSAYLRAQGETGYAALFVLILLTTVPPVPLYSTLVILSGYTFGPWPGFVLSYAASLVGAVLLFVLSRLYLRPSLSRLLAHSRTLTRALRAIDRRPRLLFLIRLAPYPYNMMNVVLAASHTLSLRTYTTCTALSLIKLGVHTSIGGGLRSFSALHDGEPAAESSWAHAYTIAGVVLCVALFAYLAALARRAVDDELDDADGLVDAEEGAVFLGRPGAEREMAEV